MSELKTRVEKWLAEQGYPLEFGTASTFRKAGFRIAQGQHYRDPQDSDTVREIDVLASIDAHSTTNKRGVRVEYVVECKWTRDTPWLVLTSGSHLLAPSACVAQTIMTKFARSLIRHSGDQLVGLETFNIPRRGGFGGCVALRDRTDSRSRDMFYAALQSVVSAAKGRCLEYERQGHAVLTMPIIVVSGALFEAYLDDETGNMVVSEQKAARLFWRGSANHATHATVDVVVADYLPTFLSVRASEAQKIVTALVRHQPAPDPQFEGE